MIHVEKQHVWQCMPAAVACSLEVPFQKVIDAIGHDGSEINNQGLREPFCRRGFHPEEIMDAAIELGFVSTTVQYCPKLAQYCSVEEFPIWSHQANKKRFLHYLNTTTGIVMGYRDIPFGGHAWSYSKGERIDPDSTGEIKSVEDFFQTEFFWSMSFLMFFTPIPEGTKGLSRD